MEQRANIAYCIDGPLTAGMRGLVSIAAAAAAVPTQGRRAAAGRCKQENSSAVFVMCGTREGKEKESAGRKKNGWRSNSDEALKVQYRAQ